MPTKTTPKNIAALIKREAELQAAVDRWGVDAFRAERDRLEKIVHSGAATDADVEAHAASREGGTLDNHYRAMQASSQVALDAYRRANWETFREFLRERLKARRDREAAIEQDVQALRDGHGIIVEYSDLESSTTAQLEMLTQSESPAFTHFGNAAEIF